ncbi:MAG: Spy/CpxP family protein refolding chaperone [Nannocystaceae bacterium]
MQRWMLIATLPLSLLFAGCDAEPEELAQDSIEVAPEKDAPLAERGHERAGHGMKKLERLCGLVSCSEDQQAKIGELLASHRGARHHERPDHDRDALSQVNADLAAKFRADALSTGDLAAYRLATSQTKGARADGKGALLLGLHGLLTPAQRSTLATEIEARGGHGLFGMGGHRRMGGDHEGAEHKGGKRHGFGLQRICKKIECTDQQLAQIRDLVEAQRGPSEGAPRDELGAANKALAAAFATDGFSQADIDRHHEAMQRVHEAHEQQMDALIVQVHALLTPDQRELVAHKIERRGLRALMGGKHGKHGKHGKRHGKRGRHGERGDHGERGKQRGQGPDLFG